MPLTSHFPRPIPAVRRALGRIPSPAALGLSTADEVDTWLHRFYGDRLSAIDAACARQPPDSVHALFGELDDDVWSLLLSRQYERYPHIRALLPSMPDPELQEMWNGISGLGLATQTKSFYTRLLATYRSHGARPLGESTVLDFGCGWGRLTRYLVRDVAPGHLYGCDPVEGILEICRSNGVAASFAKSAFVPDRIPFDERFDLAFAFSVFTHLSERAHESSLMALHEALRPGGILVVTIRPPEYLSTCDAMRPLLNELGPDPDAALADSRYLFVPHLPDPRHPQAEGTRIEYGETVVTPAYIRERWSRWFELLHADDEVDGLQQTVLTLRRASG